MKDICIAVKYIHDMGMAHRDLKPENLLYTSKGKALHVKLFDSDNLCIILVFLLEYIDEMKRVVISDDTGIIKLTDFGLCTGFRWTHNSKYYQHNINGMFDIKYSARAV